MRIQVIKVLAVSLLISVSQIAVAFSDESIGDQSAGDQSINSFDRWQMNMIYQPSQSTLDREAGGFVYIYDGFTDTQVNQVIDDKFERIDNMMFTGVKITDIEETVLIDPLTGYELVEDDGCD